MYERHRRTHFTSRQPTHQPHQPYISPTLHCTQSEKRAHLRRMSTGGAIANNPSPGTFSSGPPSPPSWLAWISHPFQPCLSPHRGRVLVLEVDDEVCSRNVCSPRTIDLGPDCFGQVSTTPPCISTSPLNSTPNRASPPAQRKRHPLCVPRLQKLNEADGKGQIIVSQVRMTPSNSSATVQNRQRRILRPAFPLVACWLCICLGILQAD